MNARKRSFESRLVIFRRGGELRITGIGSGQPRFADGQVLQVRGDRLFACLECVLEPEQLGHDEIVALVQRLESAEDASRGLVQRKVVGVDLLREFLRPYSVLLGGPHRLREFSQLPANRQALIPKP